MKMLRVCAFSAFALAIGACTKDTDGTLVVAPPLAGLRYVNLVPDTNNLDFRIVDAVSYAPNQVAATFRSGGAPSGVTTTFLPPHQAVEAGAHTIRVFVNHTHPDTASIVIFEAPFTFVANTNYTMFLWGYRRTGSTPQISAMFVQDVVPALGTDSVAIRAINLAPTLAPTLASATVDVWVDTLAAAAAPAGAPTFAALAPGSVSNYTIVRRRLAAGAVPALNYRTAIAASASTTPSIDVDIPNGTVGTATSNPIAGDLIGRSAFTAVIVPPSVVGSRAAQFAAPTIVYLTDQRPDRTAP